MSVSTMTDAPRNVEPTETAKPRKTRSDKGAPRAKLTPGELRAKADEMEREAGEKARAKAGKFLERAHVALTKAADALRPVDADKAATVAEIAEKVEGLEVGSGD